MDLEQNTLNNIEVVEHIMLTLLKINVVYWVTFFLNFNI